MPCNCRVPGSYPQIAGQILEFGTVEGELMASQNIVLPGELPSAEANPSKVCCLCPKLDHSKQSWIGVNLDVEEWKLAEFYLAEGAIGKMLVDHRGFDFTKRIVGPDGKIRYIRCVGVPVTHGATVQGFVGTGMDVTEQEQLTKALRKSEEELRQVLDFTPQLIAVYGPNRERLYANHV